ncbi:Serine/threonine-protein kinase PknK [Variovorax boronicumulans]|nr:Serine/threonine-protein kinase PknK [Variovorax boronicumulans]
MPTLPAERTKTPDAPPAPGMLPRSVGLLLSREALLVRLCAPTPHRLVVVQAPAGCGKTSLLQLWRRELVAAGSEVAWVALGSDDNDTLRLVDDLFAALEPVDPAITREARLLAGRGSDPEAVERMVIGLVQGIAASGRDIVLVLDDAHHLHAAQAVHAIQLLIEYAPANLRCALATRTALPLFLARARAADQVLQFGPDDLRFSRDESAGFLRGRLSGADERIADRLHALTDGWPAGLQLLSVALRRRPGALPEQVERVCDPKTFSAYLEHEVLSRLAPDELRLMVCCAVPSRFNASLGAALLGEPPSSAPRCAALLGRLAGEGLFMTRSGGADDPAAWWRIHPLLRDVLRARFETWPADERRRVHVAAWHWFAGDAMHHDAVRHAMLAGEAEAAAGLVEACASELFVRGELRQLVSLVRLLPPELLRERAGLRLWMAWGEVYERRLAECARTVAQLQIDLADAAPAMRYRLTLLRGLLAVQRDDTLGAMAILPELQHAPDGADGIARAGRRNILSWLYIYRGEYERARRIQLDEEPPLVEGQVLHGTPFGALVGRCLVGLAHVVEGQMIQAERIFRDVLFDADQRGGSCVDAACMAAGLLAEVLYELNDPAAAARLVEERLDVLERVSIPDTVVRVMLVLTRARRMAGRPLDAFAHLEQVEDYAQRLGLDRVLAYCLLEQFKLHVERGESEAVRQCMAQLDALDARHAGVESETLSEIAVVAERARIRLAVWDGDLQGALRRIDALWVLCERRGRIRRLAYLHLQAAVIERRLGRDDVARERTREALRIGHRLGLVRSLLDADPDALALIEAAGAEPGMDPLLAFYAQRIQASARQSHAKAGEGAGSDAARTASLELLSPRETEIVQLLQQSMPNKKIARALGVSLDTVKWHLKNVYGKLGATGRDDVVQRLRAAGPK